MYFATCISDRVAGHRCAGYLWALVVVLVIEQAFSTGTTFAAGTIYNYTYPGDSRSTRMWIPDNVGTIKGILIVGNGAGGDNRSAVSQQRYQLFGELYHFAVIGTSQWGNMSGSEISMWDNNLSGLASASYHPELVNAPWAPIGLSNGGQMSYGFNALRPDKVLAFIANKGAYYNDLLPTVEALKTPGILIAGELDTELRRTNIHSLFTNNRPRGGLWSWVEEENTAHAGMAERLVLPLMAEAIRLRYPQNQVPTATSGVALSPLDEADGWLIDVSTPVSKLTEMASYANYTGDRSIAGWFPDEGMANLFRAFSTYDKDVSFLPSPDVSTSDKLPLNVALQINTSAVPNWSKVELFDYADSIATVISNGSPSTSVTISTTLLDPGVHGLFALVTHADGVTLSTTNAIAYITVPEPSALVLLGIAAASLLAYAWRRQRQAV